MKTRDRLRLRLAIKRVLARRPKAVIMDTPERAAAAEVRLGDAVMAYPEPKFEPGAQDAMDDFFAEQYMLSGEQEQR